MSGRLQPDVVLRITAPDSAQATFVGEVKREATARQIHEALRQLHPYLELIEGARPLIIAPWLSARLRETLDAQDVSHADATGNVRLQADQPGLLLTAILLEPYDDVVFERTADRNDLTLVNPSQLAVDLLTAPAARRAKAKDCSPG